jgi:23S rRNA (guanosine2251-2'-O)-methyltransferase
MKRPNRRSHADLKAKRYLMNEDQLITLVKETPDALVLILDCVQDPHNLGACLRSADAAGAIAVVAPRDKSAPLTDVARHVAAGAAEHIPFVTVTNLARTLERLQEAGLWLVGTGDEESQLIYSVDLKGKIGIVMGAEGGGLRRLTAEKCDFLVRIPMSGSVDCLNVSVATGVCLFEAVRQRVDGSSAAEEEFIIEGPPEPQATKAKKSSKGKKSASSGSVPPNEFFLED